MTTEKETGERSLTICRRKKGREVNGSMVSRLHKLRQIGELGGGVRKAEEGEWTGF